MAVFNNMKNRKSNKKIKKNAQGMLDIFLQSRKTVKKRKNTANETNNDHCVKSDVSDDAMNLNKGCKCVGVANSTRVNKRNFSLLMHKHARVRPSSACEFDYF